MTEIKQLLDVYLENITNIKSGYPEFEVRFNTARHMKDITRIQFDNVIKKLISIGFNISTESYLLRITSDFVDDKTGKLRHSNIRTELSGISDISKYCKLNDITPFYEGSIRKCKIVQKKNHINVDGEPVRPVTNENFNFRANFSYENDLTTKLIGKSIVNTWGDFKKKFRYIKRYTLTHIDYPFNVDLSIVKQSKNKGKYDTATFTFEESEIMSQKNKYEIELEANNSRVGVGRFKDSSSILKNLKKLIKIVLSGIQETNYPVSYTEQQSVLAKYMKMLWDDKYDETRRIYPNNFVGPSSYTLKIQNIIKPSKNSNIPNIRENYTVTEKADGGRKLLFCDDIGKIYLIDTNMNVQFAGCKTENKSLFMTLIDGEHILHNKKGEFINLYAAFDIYYVNSKDIRAKGFMPLKGDDPSEFRLPILVKAIKNLKPHGIGSEDQISPLRIQEKTFYASSESQSIFDACAFILENVENDVFEYETDGLIFTPSKYGVGSDSIDKTTLPKKITWDYSFKWKPPEFNTIDFLVTFNKKADGTDEILNIFQSGIDMSSASQITQYKKATLRVGFDENKHGFIKPCRMLMDGDFKTKKDIDSTDNYKPIKFYPTNPSIQSAGDCNLLLTNTPNGEKVIFTEEGDIIEDNTIVEFKYVFDKEEGWNWIPLRVRYDKTADLQSGNKNYGNAYHVANSNWQTIHNPITLDMIKTGLDIPELIDDEDVYYNRITSSTNTKAMREFHNLYVKNMLIKKVANKGDKLIDFAVGKAGDLNKWINAKLGFVFGIDIMKDNIENRMDGACARYIKSHMKFDQVPKALFVNGTSAENILDNTGIYGETYKRITNAIYGKGDKNKEILGDYVYKLYGIGKNKFNISSIQFAIHYMFETKETLNSFLRNVSENTKVGGYFIGTSYDGERIFNLLKRKKIGESAVIKNGDTEIWSITKQYEGDEFKPDSRSLGYAIDVYQESINKTFREYLVNYKYLNSMMEKYGFKKLSKEDLKKKNISKSVGSFKDLFKKMEKTSEVDPSKKTLYKNALSMNKDEKTISFLNNYFIYKKVRDVLPSDVMSGELGALKEAIMDDESEEEKSIAKITKPKSIKKEGKPRKLRIKIKKKESKQ